MKNPLLLAVLAGVVVACGSTVADPAPVTAPAPVEPEPTAPPVPEPAAPVRDHGAVSTKYPAFAPAMGQLADNGGAVLKNPVIVTVTWAGDPKVAELEALGDMMGASAYWKATTSEYGTLGATSGEANHVHLPGAPPASISDQQLEAFVAANVTSGTFPTPATGEPIYVLQLQKATQLMLSGKSACSQGVGGYHDSTKVGLKGVAYAVVPRCGNSFDSVTVATSHELAEAATDPYPRSRPAWTGFREEDLAWEFFQQFQSENGDACEFYRDSDLRVGESDVGFTVQRQWSNASGKAGHDPCVPAFKGVNYFNVTPLGTEDLDVDLSAIGGGSATAKGYKIKVGASRQIPLGFYSDGPVSSWTIRAVAGGIASRDGSSSGVDLELDVAEGVNGNKAYLTVTVNTAGKTNSELITVVSSHAGTSHYMPILIGN